ncbi:MAG: ATP-dependent Lhr-like helicase [Myxococcota bacterium]
MKRHKILWFCNRRRDVENLSVSLREFWPKDRIVPHHGSLSKPQRESAERAMREWKWGLCVATMTLEIGVDIGDVDVVVLHGPPPTPSAFAQRVGRACRRDQTIVAIGVCLEPDDPETFEVLHELAAAGDIEPTDAPPDLGTVVQQTFSILYAKPEGVLRSELVELLSVVAPPDVLDEIWAHLEAEEYVISASGGRIRAATALMDRGEKGLIHSNVPTPRTLQFKDAATGQVLGTATTQLQVGDTVVVAGNARRVVAVGGGDVSLVPTSGPAEAPKYGARTSGGAFRWLLPESLRD